MLRIPAHVFEVYNISFVVRYNLVLVVGFHPTSPLAW